MAEVTVAVPPRPILLVDGSNVDMDEGEAGAFRDAIGVTDENLVFTPDGAGATPVSVADKLNDLKTAVDFGVVGDGVANDLPAMLRYADYCRTSHAIFYIPAHYVTRTTGTLDLQEIYEIAHLGFLFTDHDDVGVLIGGVATQAVKNQVLNRVGNDDFTPRSAPDVRAQGVKYGFVNIGNAPWIQVYADGNAFKYTSSYYTKYYIGYCQYLDLTGTNGGSINENGFWPGRVAGRIRIEGDYPHNNNVFYKPDVEGQTSIDFQTGTGNRLLEGRFELLSGSTFSFGADTIGCLVERSYVAGGYSDHVDPPSNWDNLTITDLGVNNVIRHASMLDRDRVPLVVLSPGAPIFDGGASEWATTGNVTPGFKKLTATGSIVYTSGFIPWRKNMTFVFALKNAIWRPTVTVYDENFTPISAAVDPGYATLTGGGSWSSGASSYTTGSNVGSDTSSYAFIAKTDFDGYVQVILEAGSFQDFDFAAVYSVEPYQDLRSPTRLAVQASRTTPLLTSAPTTGYAPKGYQVAKIAGGVFTCISSLERRLQSAAAASATSVTVNSGTGIANGDIVGILLDDDTTFWTTVASLSTATFTIGALPSAAAAGNRVWIGRWV